MAGALPAEEYKAALEQSGFVGVSVTIVKPHVLNRDLIARQVALSADELDALDGLSASALIKALKPCEIVNQS